MVLFGACKPKNPSLEKIDKTREIHIGAVEDHDLACLHAGSNLSSALGIGVPCSVDENEIGQETLKIESHMALCCSHAAAMFGPIHAQSQDFNGGGVQVDGLGKRCVTPLPSLPHLNPGERVLRSSKTDQMSFSPRTASSCLPACESR